MSVIHCESMPAMKSDDRHLTRPALRDVPLGPRDLWNRLVKQQRREVLICTGKKSTNSCTSQTQSSTCSQKTASINNINPATKDEIQEKSSICSGYENTEEIFAEGSSRRKNYWPIVTTGAGLFSDGYINNSISTVSTCLARLYGKEYTESRAIQNISSIVFVGTIVGQISFGYLADYHSRKRAMLIGTLLLIFFTILCAGAWGKGTHNHTKAGGLFVALTVYRFFLGIAIGSEYSSGSPAAAEASNLLPEGKRNRWFIWFTNFMIDFGFVIGAFIPLVLLWICGSNHLTPVWRITIGIGALPPMSLLYLRLRYKEGENFNKTKFNKNVPVWRIVKFYWFRIIIVSTIWFLYDFSSYAFGTYSSIIIGLILKNDAPLYQNFGWNVVFNLFYLPGAFLGAYSADYFGPRLTLAVGLICQCAIGFALGGALESLKRNVAGFVVTYGIFMTLGEFSAGDNIGCIASKTSATPIRGTIYGICAMVGKLGSFVGTYIFPTIIRRYGLNVTYYIASGMCVISAILSLLFLPDLDQEAMSREDSYFLEYLSCTGYDVSELGTRETQEKHESDKENF